MPNIEQNFMPNNSQIDIVSCFTSRTILKRLNRRIWPPPVSRDDRLRHQFPQVDLLKGLQRFGDLAFAIDFDKHLMPAADCSQESDTARARADNNESLRSSSFRNISQRIGCSAF